MKLYVWDDVLQYDSGGIMFALAEGVEQAREMLLEGILDRLPITGRAELAMEPKVYDLTEPVARIFLGLS